MEKPTSSGENGGDLYEQDGLGDLFSYEQNFGLFFYALPKPVYALPHTHTLNKGKIIASPSNKNSLEFLKPFG